MVGSQARRVLAVWVPDWSATAAIAAGLAPPEAPVGIDDGRHVVSASASARAAGVRRGMRRRSAQSLCPDLVLVARDEVRDVRAFEPVAVAVAEQLPGVELIRPGLLLSPSRGGSRYFGGDEELAIHLLGCLVNETGLEVGIGIADGLLASIIAARQSVIVPPGGSREFLAPLPLACLDQALAGTPRGDQVSELTGLLSRLGLRTLGQFAELPRGDVLARFGDLGRWAWRLVQGLDSESFAMHRPAPEFSRSEDLDPPAETADRVAFAARRLIEQLYADLARHGQSYARLLVEARTCNGDELSRSWRLEGVDAAGAADRVRWQLEGWIAGRSGDRPSAALSRLTVSAQEVGPAARSPDRLWGGASRGQQSAARAADRVQVLLGADGVVSGVRQGGRDPRSRIRLVVWGDERIARYPLSAPWPGGLPSPSPATVLEKPLPVDLWGVAEDAGDDLAGGSEAGTADGGSTDTGSTDDGPTADTEPGGPTRRGHGGLALAAPVALPVRRLVTVNAHAELSVAPRWLQEKEQRYVVHSWAGPWPVCERWWSEQASRRVYLQVQLTGPGPLGEAALLLRREEGCWLVEGIYD